MDSCIACHRTLQQQRAHKKNLYIYIYIYIYIYTYTYIYEKQRRGTDTQKFETKKFLEDKNGRRSKCPICIHIFIFRGEQSQEGANEAMVVVGADEVKTAYRACSPRGYEGGAGRCSKYESGTDTKQKKIETKNVLKDKDTAL